MLVEKSFHGYFVVCEWFINKSYSKTITLTKFTVSEYTDGSKKLVFKTMNQQRLKLKIFFVMFTSVPDLYGFKKNKFKNLNAGIQA